MGISITRLRWLPADFWRATPAEFWSAIEALEDMNRDRDRG